MPQKPIKLELNKTLTKIAGFKYGKDIYEKQANDYILFDCENVIEFPSHVDFVAPSFIQGFIAEPMREVGSTNILEIIRFHSPRPEVMTQIYDDLRMAM